MQEMNFTTATAKATGASITLSDIAQACGVSLGLINRARMDPEGPHARKPPEQWRACVARLCRKRGMELLRLADQLNPEE